MSPQPTQVFGRAGTWLSKGSTLFLISVLEGGLPFVRMILLARFLDLRELGFASALAATYGIFEVTTDLSVHRFVFRAPPDEFDDAMASAHALMLLRGLVVCSLAILTAPLVAALLSVGSDWKIFAALGPLSLVRSFENLGPRVAERRYQFSAQLKMTLATGALGLSALGAALYLRHDHTAVVMALLGQNIGLVGASHLFSASPYRLKFRSPQFIRAFRFGYPLMINGFGIAVSGQADRFIVGSLLGLQTLGIYNVVLLVTVVPISMVFRVMGTTNLAALFNVSGSPERFVKRLHLIGQISPIVATFYALGIAALMNVVTPVVFGARFAIGRTEITLLALAAFVKIVRVEPFTSLLLLERRTKRLAATSLAVLSGLAFAYALIKVYPTMDSALAGRMLGELTSLGVTIALTRSLLRDHPGSYGSAVASGFLIVTAACIALALSPPGRDLLFGPLTLAVGAVIIIGWVILIVRESSLSTGAENFAPRIFPSVD